MHDVGAVADLHPDDLDVGASVDPDAVRDVRRQVAVVGLDSDVGPGSAVAVEVEPPLGIVAGAHVDSVAGLGGLSALRDGLKRLVDGARPAVVAPGSDEVVGREGRAAQAR